jgi:hypothetical protein
VSTKGYALALLIGSALGLSACKKDSQKNDGAAQAKSSVATGTRASDEQPDACRFSETSAKVTLGDTGGKIGDEEDDELDVPFGVEIGQATSLSSGFAAGALDNTAKGSQAYVVLVAANGEGRTISLGRSYGAAGPPLLAASGDDVVVAVPDQDAGGAMLRLMSVRDAAGKPDVREGAHVALGRGQSHLFGIAVSEGRALLVWEDVTQTRNGVVRGASLSWPDAAKTGTAIVLSPSGHDAEMPRLAARPGGFWLTMFTAPTVAEGSDDAEADPLRVEPRSIEVTLLDAAGKALGAPVRATPSPARVLAYHAATDADGSLVLAYRNAGSRPEAEEREVHLARVAPDGSVERHVLPGDGLSGGLPLLIRGIGSDPAVWLTLGGAGEPVQLGKLAGVRLVGSLARDDVLRSAEVLAARAGHTLVARPRGRGADFSIVTCSPALAAPTGDQHGTHTVDSGGRLRGD